MSNQWNIRKAMVTIVAGTLALAMTACGTAPVTTGVDVTGDTQIQNTKVSGKVTLAGSTSMEKISKALIEGFAEVNQDITVTAEFTGSSAGVKGCLDGSIDVGNVSRELKEEEKASGAVGTVVAIDGIAVVINPKNAVADLSKEDLTKIYTGEIKKWSEVGGTDSPIVVVGREAGSGTRGAFEELLKVEDACKYAQELNSTGSVKTTVASTENAIGYISLDVLDDTVKAVTIDGAEATEEAILAGGYALSRPFIMATKGEIAQQSETVKLFMQYALSDAGQEVVKSVGLISNK